MPKTWAKRAYRTLAYFNEVDEGDRFAAWEQPELFSAERRLRIASLVESSETRERCVRTQFRIQGQ